MNTTVRGCLRRVDVRSHGTSEGLKRAEFGAKIHFWNSMKAPFGRESGLLRHPLSSTLAICDQKG